MAMRRTMRAAMLLCCAATLIGGAMAQQPDGPPAGPPPAGAVQGPPPGGPGRGGEGRLQQLQQQLNLSPDQVTQIRAAMQDSRAKMEALHSNSALSQQDRRTQMMSLHEEQQAKLKTILTPEQFSKLQEMEAAQRERMRDRGPGGPGFGGQGPGGPPPPPPASPQ